jgi:hypothetical protein
MFVGVVRVLDWCVWRIELTFVGVVLVLDW